MRAHKLHEEALAVPKNTDIARMKAITTNLQVGTEEDKEFERRYRIAEGMLKEREVELKERTALSSRESTDRPSQPSPLN
jgi:hypothetical protein